MLRPAYLAGRWYPDSARECQAAIETHARDATPEQGSWRAVIGPHAGWTYSGDAAGRSYRWLAEARPDPDLVVVFGSHRGPRGPNTVFVEEGWQTPLGPLKTAGDLAIRVRAELDFEEEPASPFHPDNAVELHLPFVRHFFSGAELLMVGVEASVRAIEIGGRIAELIRDAKRNPVFVGSTDLTHYGPNYDFEPAGDDPATMVPWVREQNDGTFIRHVLERDLEGLIGHAQEHNSACCPGAVAACIAAARSFDDNQPRLIDHYLSYDVMPSHSFVGYAGIIL